MEGSPSRRGGSRTVARLLRRNFDRSRWQPKLRYNGKSEVVVFLEVNYSLTLKF